MIEPAIPDLDRLLDTALASCLVDLQRAGRIAVIVKVSVTVVQ